MDTDLAQLISMGFSQEESSRALSATNRRGIQPALDWLLEGGQSRDTNVVDDFVNIPQSNNENLNSIFGGNPQDFSLFVDEDQPISPSSYVSSGGSKYSVRFIEDIPYEPFSHEKHMVDVLVPIDAPKGLRPVVVHVHGGGWQRGDRKAHFYGSPFMGSAYAQRGFVCVLISYRVGVTFPDPILDVAFAVKWTLNFIETYGGDPNAIFLSGHSSGGHLVSLLVSHPDYLRMASIPPSTIKGVISISGIYTVGNPLSGNPNDIINILYRQVYVNRIFGVDPQVWSEASPSYYVLKIPEIHGKEVEVGTDVELHKLPPFCLFNATKDFMLDFDGKKFHEILVKRGIPVHYHVIPASTHATITRLDVVVDKCVEFICFVLGNKYS